MIITATIFLVYVLIVLKVYSWLAEEVEAND